MNFLRKLERKFGKYAIPHLTLYIIVTYVAGYLFSIIGSVTGASLLSYMTLSPSAILHGQIWRIVSWILVPPSSSNILIMVIMLFFYYSIGTQLERVWGDFLYNFYIFTGLIFTVIGAFVLYAITGIDPVIPFSTEFVSTSIFLGAAMTFPDMQVLYMFIIPLKIKYLAYVDIAFILYDVVAMFRVGTFYGITELVMVVCSLAGTILFFLLMKSSGRPNRQQKRRQRDFQKAMHGYRGSGSAGRSGSQSGSGAGAYTTKSGSSGIARHRCAVCGRTEITNPELEFRFCSKCNGNYEYCSDHIHNHEHVK